MPKLYCGGKILSYTFLLILNILVDSQVVSKSCLCRSLPEPLNKLVDQQILTLSVRFLNGSCCYLKAPFNKLLSRHASSFGSCQGGHQQLFLVLQLKLQSRSSQETRHGMSPGSGSKARAKKLPITRSTMSSINQKCKARMSARPVLMMFRTRSGLKARA